MKFLLPTLLSSTLLFAAETPEPNPIVIKLDIVDRTHLSISGKQGGLSISPRPVEGFDLFSQNFIPFNLSGNDPIFVTINNPALEAVVATDTNTISIRLLPAAPNSFLIDDIQLPIFASVNHINFRLERELVKVRERFCDCACRWNLFGGFIGTQGELDSRRNHQFDYASLGGLAGIDFVFRQWGFGASFNYDNIYSTNDHHGDHFNIDFWHGDFFGTFVPICMPTFSFDGIVGFGRQWWDTDRHVFTGGLTDPLLAHGGIDVTEWDILFGGANTFMCGSQGFTLPYATIQFIRLNVENFDEEEAEFFGFRHKERDIESLRSVLGFRWFANYCYCNFKISPEIDLGWEHEFYNNHRRIFFVPLIDELFSITEFRHNRVGRDFLLLAADVNFGFRSFGLDISYDLEWNPEFQNHTYYVGGNFRF